MQLVKYVNKRKLGFCILVILVTIVVLGSMSQRILMAWSDFFHEGKFVIENRVLRLQKDWYIGYDADWFLVDSLGLSTLSSTEYYVAHIDLYYGKCAQIGDCVISAYVYEKNKAKRVREKLKTFPTLKFEWGEVKIVRDGRAYFSENYNIFFLVSDPGLLKAIESISLPFDSA